MELGQLEADDVVTVSGDPADPNYGIRGLKGGFPKPRPGRARRFGRFIKPTSKYFRFNAC